MPNTSLVSLIDPEALQGFRDLNSDESPYFVREFFEEVLKTLPERFRKLEAAIRAADAKSLSFEAHAFKSTCANCGIESMTQLCQQLEMMGKSGSVSPDAPTIFKRLSDLRQQLESEIRELPEFAGLAAA